MIPTDGMAIPRIKQCFSFFIRGIAMPSVGILGPHDSSIAICGTSRRFLATENESTTPVASAIPLNFYWPQRASDSN